MTYVEYYELAAFSVARKVRIEGRSDFDKGESADMNLCNRCREVKV